MLKNIPARPQHSDGFKTRMVERLAQGESVKELAQEANVSTTTIYNWRDQQARGDLKKEPAAEGRFNSLEDLKEYAESRTSVYQRFPDSFKREVLRQIKELGVRPSVLLRETGISQAALYRWLKEDEYEKSGLPTRQPRTQQDRDSLVIAYLRSQYRNARYQVQLLTTAFETLLDSLEPREEDEHYHKMIDESRAWLNSDHPVAREETTTDGPDKSATT